MSGTRFKIMESLWVSRSDFYNGLNLILLLYGLAVLLTEVVYPNSGAWTKLLRFYGITVVAMYFVRRAVCKLPRAPQQLSSKTPSSPSSS